MMNICIERGWLWLFPFLVIGADVVINIVYGSVFSL